MVNAYRCSFCQRIDFTEGTCNRCGTGRLLRVYPASEPLFCEEVERSQAWYWTPEWQAGEAEADADIAAGRVTYHDSDESFLASLEEVEREREETA